MKYSFTKTRFRHIFQAKENCLLILRHLFLHNEMKNIQTKINNVKYIFSVISAYKRLLIVHVCASEAIIWICNLEEMLYF